MTTSGSAVVLVYSTGHALKAEKAIKAHGIGCKLISVPHI
ncbi:MAG: putative Se/S carrier-like protein [Aggregatilineales bacterium]